MNKKIELSKDTYVLFFINILILFLLILFNIYYINHNYNATLIIITLILNIVILVFSIILNIILAVQSKKESSKKNTIIIFFIFIIFIFINLLGTYFINLSLSKKYNNISDNILKYCDLYDCSKYETVKQGLNKKLIIYREYLDYDNNLNDIIFSVEYNTRKILKITSVIYSDNELFSEELIFENLNNFYEYIGEKISKEEIKDAFDKRFEKSIIKDNITYNVKEIYKNEELYKIRTTIIVKK